MTLDRRTMIGLLAAGVVSGLASAHTSTATRSRRYSAIAFDAFPIFDPRSIPKLAEILFPGKGVDLTNAWRSRQFEYQWLRALGGRYADFWRATEDSLIYAARSIRLDLPSDKRDQMMQAFLQLEVWPDVRPVLMRLREAGIRLAFLSNWTRAMLETNMHRAKLEGLFEHVLSTDQVRSYKPDPRAYAMAVKAFGLKREEIAFAASAGWDAVGAKWYGFPTFWVNRLGSPAEEMDVSADGVGPGLDDLARFVLPSS